MVSAVSLIGTAFAVGGSYFAVDSLRDILIAKTINTSYATRIAIASAAAFAGLMVISKDSASKASKQTKDRLGKQLLSAEEDDPNYMVKSDIHKIAESGIKMNVLMDEFPEADLPIWWKSKISVTASQADDLADNLGYVLAEPEAFDAEGTKVRRHSLDRFTKQRKPSMDSFRRRGRRSALRSLLAAEDDTVYMIRTEYHDWDNWRNDCISYDSFGPYATEAGAKRALTRMMKDAAEDWTNHSSLRDPETGEPMFTFELDRDEYGNVEIKPSGMSLSDFTFKHTKTEHKGGRDFDGMTYGGVVVTQQMIDDEEDYCDECGEEWPDDCECESYEADSDDDDDDTGLVPDREPRRGAPDLWFAEIYEAECASCDTTHGFDFMCATCGICLDCDPCTHSSTDKDAESSDYRRFTPQEAVEYLRSGDNTVWLIDYADENYGDDERPHYDYPVEDPEDLETMIADGVFDEDTASNGFVPTIANGTSYDLGLWDDEPGGIHPSFHESPDWMKGMNEEEYAVWANAWNSRSRGAFTDKDAEWDESSRTMWDQSEITDPDELVRLGKIFKVGSGTTDSWQEYLDESGPFVYVTKNTRPWALWQPGSREAVVRFNSRGKTASMLADDIKQLYEAKPDDYGFDAEVFEAFSLSDRPVSVKFGPGTSGNAKMKATFTDASGDTKTTQFGYKGMSDFTKHKDEGRRDSYLARHGSKGQNQNWKDPTTAGALSRYVLWEKTSLPAAKSAFKKRFNLRAEDLDTEDSYVGYQVSPFITETDRMAAWVYEPVYSDEDAL